MPEGEDCVSYMYLLHDTIEGSHDCLVFIYSEETSSYVYFGEIDIDSTSETLAFLTDFDEWPEVWTSTVFNPIDIEICAYGCIDSDACNYDENAVLDDGSCDYGVECFVSPCSVSEAPYVEGAYCVDDYCSGCCAIWYYQDGTLLYNSCEDEIDLTETHIKKTLIQTIDLLGRSTHDKGFQLEIYDDGTVKKKYVN